jgi:hypothetical protein
VNKRCVGDALARICSEEQVARRKCATRGRTRDFGRRAVAVDWWPGLAASSNKTERWQREKRWSRPISRVLSRTTIPLGRTSPCASSDLPGSACGPHVRHEAACSPIWSCSRRGLPCHRVLPPARCALTAPFHPYRPNHPWWVEVGLAVCFLLHFPWAHAPQGLPGALPVGARTFLHACAQRLPGRLRREWWGRRCGHASEDDEKARSADN